MNHENELTNMITKCINDSEYLNCEVSLMVPKGNTYCEYGRTRQDEDGKWTFKAA